MNYSVGILKYEIEISSLKYLFPLLDSSETIQACFYAFKYLSMEVSSERIDGYFGQRHY